MERRDRPRVRASLGDIDWSLAAGILRHASCAEADELFADSVWCIPMGRLVERGKQGRTARAGRVDQGRMLAQDPQHRMPVVGLRGVSKLVPNGSAALTHRAALGNAVPDLSQGARLPFCSSNGAGVWQPNRRGAPREAC